MLDVQKLFLIQNMEHFSICCIDKTFSSIQNMNVFICSMNEMFLYIEHIDNFSIFCM